MTDPYATLGIAPDADEQAVRAAYRAAMKRTHPDQNPSADAADQARAVAAAYKLLSDPAQRARLDRQRAMREQVIAPPPPPPPRSAPRGRLGGLALVLLSIGILWFATTRLAVPTAPPASAPHPTQLAAAEPAPDLTPPPELVPAPPAPPMAAPPTAQPVAAPPPTPPAAAPVLPRSAPPTPAKPAPPHRQAAVLAVAAPTAPPPPVAITTTPDDCDRAATCARIDLAALDHMQTLLYNQSYLAAPAPKQAQLLSTRATFLARLGRCISAACKRDAYLDRNREIAALMRS
ncbi:MULTISPECIES: J domain-containing protein [Sphingomonas]|uniref:J domain-containing protein n=1 Tax=Sphingomonas TaxID=13687 RepID=UPI0013B3DAC1|nr:MULTISPECIES: DnaJ domain-containing protein [Sphingomonas]